MKTIITDYLTVRCERDSDLADKFQEERMDDCIEYIVKMAKNHLDNQNGAIMSDTVFEWARDYFVNGTAELDRIEKEKEEKEAEERKKKAEEDAKKKAEDKFMNDQHKDGQISLFDFAGV